jgi:hypothetical protein
LNTENTLNSELKSLSRKIREYLSGEDVPDKPLYLTGMKGRLQLSPDGLEVIPNPDYEAAYKEALESALEIKQAYSGLPKLPSYESDPTVGLQYLWEWCSDSISGKVDLPSEKAVKTEQKSEGSMLMITGRLSKDIWEAIKSEYDTSKRDFGKKINFVSDSFKRKIIFRDIEHAFVLASNGFSKPALILAGGVIEELLRLYLEHKKIKPKSKSFDGYIKTCEDKGLLKRGVYRLSDSIRDFRNLVHLKNEETKRHTVSKATAKGAVSSIFTIANDFQ